MRVDRRQLLAAGSVGLASCAARGSFSVAGRGTRLDRLLAAHAEVLPERAGAGANHYPMAAEALEALGHADAIDDGWVEGAALYRGPLGTAGPIESEADASTALGAYGRFGDWLAYFRSSLEREPWRVVVGRWAARLAPGLVAAAYHGVIRTGHAVRALGRSDSPERRHELAVGLAYWAARYVELPTTGDPGPAAGETLAERLPRMPRPWLADPDDVPFDGVVARLTERPLTAGVDPQGVPGDPTAQLEALVHAAALGFLEMLVAERHRIWMLHTVTGPAALEWLLPLVPPADARRLVGYAHQSVLAMAAAFGEPYTPGAHLHTAPAPWPELVRRAADSRSVHGIKLIDALLRFDRGGDPLWRSVAVQWFLWT